MNKSRMARLLIVVAVPLVALALVLNDGDQPTSGWIPPADGQAKVQGKQLYTTYCASCHGTKLEGQFNWRQRMSNGRLPAPPHDDSGHTWHHPDEQLFAMIKYGLVPGQTAPAGYQSDMPAFASVLNDEQIKQVLAYIKTHWSNDSIAMQKKISNQH